MTILDKTWVMMAVILLLVSFGVFLWRMIALMFLPDKHRPKPRRGRGGDYFYTQNDFPPPWTSVVETPPVTIKQVDVAPRSPTKGDIEAGKLATELGHIWHPPASDPRYARTIKQLPQQDEWGRIDVTKEFERVGK